MTLANSEQSAQDAEPLELYRISVGAALAAPVPGETTVTDVAEDFEGYATSTPAIASGPAQQLVDTPPDAGLAVDDLHHDWGVACTGGGILTLTLETDVTAPSGSQVAQLAYNNASWQSQYFGRVDGYAVYGPFTIGARYNASAFLNADWDFTNPTIQGPCGWGAVAVGDPQSVGGVAGADAVNDWGAVPFILTALAEYYRVWFGYTYGNSNWEDTTDNPRHLQIDGITFDRVTNDEDPGESPAPTLIHHTSADVDVPYAGDTYTRAQIVRTEYRAGKDERAGAEVELTIPRDHALATIAGGGPPRLPVTIEFIRLHRSDLTAAITPRRWQVVGSRFEGPSCVLRCATVRAMLDRKVPRYLTQKTCGHMLYDGLCQASRLANTRGPFPVSAIDGRTVTVDGAGAAMGLRRNGFRHGVLITPGGLMGGIEAVDGDLLTLKQRLPGLAVSDEVSLVFGCDKLPGTCNSEFHNIRHFGGESVLPLQNPGTTGLAGGSA